VLQKPDFYISVIMLLVRDIMEKIITFFNRNKFDLILIIVWLVIAMFSLMNHEIWRDEAQVWCIVRDLGLYDVFKMSRIEGHPILWYLLVFPFAKMGFSVISMQVLSLLFVFASVSFLVFKSPFNFFEKFIIIFSAGMIYYLPIVSRNYCLIPIFLFALVNLYPKRLENPYKYICLIVLLCYTHLYMLGFCLILSLVFSVEQISEYLKNKNIKMLFPIFLLFINFVILLITFFNVQNENYALESDIRMGMSLGAECSLVAKIFSYNLVSLLDCAKNHFNLISLILLYPWLFIVLYSFFKADKKIGLISILGILYMFFIFTKVYFNGILYQKAFLIFLILIFGFWAAKEKMLGQIGKAGKIAFCILFIISVFTSPFVLADDYQYNFSGGKEIANYIKNNLNKENTFLAIGNPFLYSSISAYLPKKKFYNMISKTYISYYTFYNADKIQNENFPKDALYSIVQENIKLSDNPYLELIFESSSKNISSKTEREVFRIYKEKSYDLIIAVD